MKSINKHLNNDKCAYCNCIQSISLQHSVLQYSSINCKTCDTKWMLFIIICFFLLFFKRYKYIWENKDFIQFIKLCLSHWRCDCKSVGNRTIIIQNRMRENYKYKYDLNLRPLFLLRCYSNFTCICCSTSVYALFFSFNSLFCLIHRQ